jgi:hypothetical protein
MVRQKWKVDYKLVKYFIMVVAIVADFDTIIVIIVFVDANYIIVVEHHSNIEDVTIAIIEME